MKVIDYKFKLDWKIDTKHSLGKFGCIAYTTHGGTQYITTMEMRSNHAESLLQVLNEIESWESKLCK